MGEERYEGEREMAIIEQVALGKHAQEDRNNILIYSKYHHLLWL